jgi:chorismate dehydratase
MTSERKFKKVETADGTYTLWHPLFEESYHSVTAGALEESVKKFLIPSQLPFLVKEKNEINLLEVGFGLGYNLVATYTELKKLNPEVFINYVGFERELSPLLKELKLPEPYTEIYEKIKENLLKGKEEFEVGRLRVKLLFGDARKRIEELKGQKFDAVYHDAFSPRKNTELWTLEFLREIKSLLTEEGFWVSYSIALPVRKALFELGFQIYNTKPVGRRSPGTAATLKGIPHDGRIYPLTPKEKEKLFKSPKAVPFRDPCLCLPREEIWKNYQKEVAERSRKIT